MDESSPRIKQGGAAHLPYRSDIDGLRAVAVLLVLGAHFKTHISGGFIGVDVFFVISGYLISAAILKEMAQGTFSIVNFYERRIRRIFPALIVMVLGTVAMAYHFLFPAEMVDFAKSLLAAIFSVSNFWFWHQQGYFDAPSALKPFLHTWSLAVEEQFYIFFPIFLVLVRRIAPSRWLKWFIFGIAAISLVLAAFYAWHDESAAFFFAPLRAWELLIGTIVSQRYLPSVRSAVGRNLATLAGFLMILVPALLYSDKTVFPGLTAIPPRLGAALIIAGGETGSSAVGKLLSLRPVVFVGLISYSLYLWHWPVEVFQTIGGMLLPLPPSDRRLKLALFVVSLILGTLSWLLVETPFRKGRIRPGRSALFLVNGAAVALIAVIGVGLVLDGGLPSRFTPQTLQIAQYLAYDQREPLRAGSCFVDIDEQFSVFQQNTCLAPDPSKKSLLVIGDSHAADIWLGISRTFPEYQVLQATAGACVMSVQQPPNARPGCRDLANFLYGDYLQHHHIDAVLLAQRWNQDIAPPGPTIAFLKQLGIQVYLVGPSIEYDLPFPRILASSLRFNQPELVARHMTPEPAEVDRKMAQLARDEWKVPYISYFANLCGSGCPSYAAPGVPFMCDADHLTSGGAILFAQSIRDRHELPLP